MAYPTHNRFGVDTLWFQNAIRNTGESSNSLADSISMHRSALSRKVTGKLRITYDDAELLAGALRVPLSEVLARGTVNVRMAPMPPVTGRVDQSGALMPWDGPKPVVRDLGSLEVPQEGMSVPLLVPVLVRGAAPDTAKGSLPGLAVLADGRVLLRVIRPGSQAGRHYLLPAFGLGEREHDVELVRIHWVAPAMFG